MTATVIPFRRREQDAKTAPRDLDNRPIGAIMADWDKLLAMIGNTMQEPKR